MSRRYLNFRNKIEHRNMKLITTKEEFIKDRMITFSCPNGHISTLHEFSFNNKSNPKNLSKLKSLCADCNYLLQKEDEAVRLLVPLNFKLIRVEKDLQNFIAIVHFINVTAEIFPKHISIILKNCFKRKKYISPCGKEYFVLGYEGRVLDILHKNNTKGIIHAGEDEEIPSFSYLGYDNKLHIYYPDIFIPLENKIIEVKSDYIYNLNPVSNLAKALAVSETHIFQIWILDQKRVLEILECLNGIFYSKYGGNLILGDKYNKLKKN